MTSSRLRKGERCPLHNSFYCCGRSKPKPRKQSFRQTGPVIRVMDNSHPRGYREECSAAELRRRKNELIRQSVSCLYCTEPFTDYRQVELAHRNSKGMGGFKRDDHRDNLGLAHRWCNRKNGSRSAEVA